MQRLAIRARSGWQLYGSRPPADGGVIRNRQIEAARNISAVMIARAE